MMKYNLLKLLPVILLLLPLCLFAQQQTMRGVVSDKSGTLTGATVYLQNKDHRIVVGAVTGLQGEYLINLPSNTEGMSIVISFVGYKTKTVPYTGQKNFNIKIEEDSQTLSTIEVKGKAIVRDNMGINRNDMGSATEIIDVTKYEDMSVSSIEDLLQGKMANLDIVSASGDPGTSSTIRIRGAASLNANNDPLIVIDGIPQDTKVDNDFDFGDADVEDFGALVNISPNDIQSIEVLKDASATTMWGPKAANGVLLITTKQGGNHKPRFSISQKLNYTFEPKGVEMLNGQEYVTLMQDALWNWIKDGDFMASRVKKLDNQKDIGYDQSYEYFKEFNQDTDWLKLITQNSLNSTTDFSMSGGGEKASYRFSLGYEDQVGTTKGADYNRITSRLNLNYKFSKKFAVDSRFNYAESTRNQPYETDISGDPLNVTARNIALRKMPNMSPWVLDQYGIPTDEYFSQPSSSIQGNLPNPLALANESTNRTLARTIGASFSTSYLLFKGMQVIASIAFDMSTSRNNKYLPESVINVLWSDVNYNKGIEALSNSAHTYANVRLNYNKTFNKVHRTVFSLAESIESTNTNSYSLSTSGNGAKEVSLPSSGGKITNMGSGWAKRRTVSFLGAFNYNYKDLYSIVLSGRLNANSNTGVNNRWRAPRPSISGVWKLHNEKFLRKVKWIDELKLRGSWARSERTPDSNYTTGTFAFESDYMTNTSIKPQQMQLDGLRPEVVTQYNIGFNAILLDNKIDVIFELYSKKSTDLLQKDTKIQSTTGFSTIRFFNSGQMLNKGWELIVSLNNIAKLGEFKFSLRNLNISRNINEILELPKNMEPSRFTLGNGNYARSIIEGNPLGSIYGFKFLGIYQNYDHTLARDANGNVIKDINGNKIPMKVGGSWRQRPGDAMYADINHDGNINEYDIVYLGNSYPTITGGATLNIEYKGWSFRTSIHFRLGQSVVNNTRHETEKMNNGNNQSKMSLSRWRHEGDQTSIPRALWGTNYNSLGSDKFVEDASFLKFKDVTINYRLPQKFVKKMGISRANVFVTTYNLFTISNYSGQDPEVGIPDGAYSIALDNGRTPPARRIAAGLSFDF